MIAPEGTPQRSLPAPLWKKLAGIWSLVAVFVAAVWLWPDSGPSRTPGPEGLRPVSCDARASGPRLLTTPIEEIRVFDWLVAENPYGSSPDERVDAVDWLDWRVLSLRILKPDGSAAEIELARPLAWVESQEATLGGEIWLDLPEMGISGWAEVHEIRECPDPGRRPSPRHWLVTATFKHTSDQVVRLQVSGEAQSLGVTASHPIWSVDRREFVEVGALDRGERVLGLDGGEHLVAAVLPRPGPTALYNLEVYGAHVYHVGASGLMAHNMCAAERAGKGISAARLGTSPAPIAGKLSAEASDVLRTEARDIWYATTGRRAIWAGLQIHHRIPLEWSHLFPRANPNRLSNLVGVDRATHTLINDTWVAWKRGLHGRAPTQSEIMKQVLHTDNLFGGSWVFPK